MPENFLYDAKKLEEMNQELISRLHNGNTLLNGEDPSKRNPELMNGFIKGDVEMQIDSFVEPPDQNQEMVGQN